MAGKWVVRVHGLSVRGPDGVWGLRPYEDYEARDEEHAEHLCNMLRRDQVQMVPADKATWEIVAARHRVNYLAEVAAEGMGVSGVEDYGIFQPIAATVDSALERADVYAEMLRGTPP